MHLLELRRKADPDSSPSIIYIASTTASIVRGSSLYISTQQEVFRETLATARDLDGKGIRVNCVTSEMLLGTEGLKDTKGSLKERHYRSSKKNNSRKQEQGKESKVSICKDTDVGLTAVLLGAPMGAWMHGEIIYPNIEN